MMRLWLDSTRLLEKWCQEGPKDPSKFRIARSLCRILFWLYSKNGQVEGESSTVETDLSRLNYIHTYFQQHTHQRINTIV